MIRLVAIAAALVVTGGGLAVAQSSTGMALVDAMFSEGERTGNLGSAAARTRGAMGATGFVDSSFALVPGRSYMAVGLCDEHCTDLNLEITGPAGAPLGSDLRPVEHALVQFMAHEAGDYTVRTSMAGCAATRCNYGVRIYPR